MYVKDNYTNNTKNDKKVDVNTILFYNIHGMDMNLDNIPDQWNTDNPSKTKRERSSAAVTGNLRLELPEGCVLEKVLVRIVS